MNQPRPARSTVLTLAFLTMATLLWLAVRTYYGGTFRLADGRQVAVLAVTVGTNHVLVHAKPWVKMAARFVSSSKAVQLGLTVLRRNTPKDDLIVWTYWRLPTSNSPPSLASVCDRNGVESEPQAATLDAPYPQTGEAIMAWRLTNVPRHQGRVALRLYERDPDYRLRRVGEILVRLPRGDRAPRWNAQAPPIAVKQGDQEFLLVALRTAEPVSLASKAPQVQIAPWTTAFFEVRQHGVADPAWTVRSLEASSATGNRFSLPQPRVEQIEARSAVSFPEVLWPDEPEWKFLAEFSQTGNFGAQDLWTLKSMPAARSGPPSTTNFGPVVHGLWLQSLDIRGTTRIMRPERGGYRRTTDLTLLFTSAVQRVHVDLARIVDDRGRDVRFGNASEPWPGKFTAGLELPLDARAVDLTFAIHPSKRVEFLARSPVSYIRTNASSQTPR